MTARGEAVTVLARVDTGQLDRYGKSIYHWPLPGVQVDGCAVEPQTSTEPVEIGRRAVHIALAVYMPRGAHVGPYDRLIVRELLYEVTGQPGTWTNPYTRRTWGIALTCTRVEG